MASNNKIEKYVFNDPELDSIDYNYSLRGLLIDKAITKTEYLAAEKALVDWFNTTAKFPEHLREELFDIIGGNG